jgi:hypothetical protein
MANHPLHGATVLLAATTEGRYSTHLSSRRDGAQRHHDTTNMPPSRWSDRAWRQERGVTVVPYLSAQAHPQTDGTRRTGTECDGHSARQDMDGGRPRTRTNKADSPDRGRGARNSLSASLFLPLVLSSPVKETPLDYKREGQVLRKGDQTIPKSKRFVLHSKACNSLTLTST